ncbi:MAG: hypothetical protein J7M06_05900 [Proteobacteria bacterium]|nr:hypothetical protein [Pseudomonadota bacterium]
MRYLDEWAKDKPQILVIIAQQIAIGAESFFEFLISVKAGERIDDPATVPSTTKDWLSLYKDHKRIQRSLVETLKKIGKIEETSTEFEEFLLGILRCMRMIELKKLGKEMEKLDPAEQREIIKAGQKDVKESYNLHLADVGDISGIVDEELEKVLKIVFKKPEMVFFIRI